MNKAFDLPALTPGTRVPSLADGGYEELRERRPAGLVLRFLTTFRHLVALLCGGLIDTARQRKAAGTPRLLLRISAIWARLLVAPSMAKLPFPIQLRKRLEILGPTYIKLGQVLSLRTDLLPRSLTEELKNLLDRLPAVPFPRFVELVSQELDRPVTEMFRWIEPIPEGSASIAQIHRATTLQGDSVIIKLVKPGIPETLERDARLLSWVGNLLQLVWSRYQPKLVIREFCEYTLREVDLRREADHCELFAANFEDQEEIHFPRIYRELSGRSVLCMEFFDGHRPDTEAAGELSEEAKDQLVDLGVSAIIRMLYQDGFFHADLHPGNLLILPGPHIGFIDVGMVGRLDDRIRRTLLYYFYCLVSGDSVNAARYLTAVATVSTSADPAGFQRAVEELGRRWQRSSRFTDFSFAQMILESISLGARFRVYFPVELVLMAKALVTFEAVGNMLVPDFDVAARSKTHLNNVLLRQFAPWRLAREALAGTPELIEAVVKMPLLVGEGLRFLEQTTERRQENPFSGIRGTLFGGFCLLAGAVLAAAGGNWLLWSSLFAAGLLAGLRK